MSSPWWLAGLTFFQPYSIIEFINSMTENYRQNQLAFHHHKKGLF
jgi:hypothetical protein